MSSGLKGFLVSSTIVVTGLTGLWAWPTVQDGGIDALVARGTDLYHRAEFRFRPENGAIQFPAEDVGNSKSPIAALNDDPTNSAPPQEVARLQAAASAPIVPDRCDASGLSNDTAVIGDRVQLRIFETSILAGVPNREDGTMAVDTNIVFERLDISGTYEVSANGAVSLPAIGHVTVAGYSLPCIEALVARAAFERMRTQNSISAAYSTRPPILVRGAVRAPGAHAFSPGLTVERLLAQAGALDERDPASQVRLITLESRRSELNRERVSLALERMRIEAALKSRQTLPQDDTIEIALALLGEDRVASERGSLAAEIEADRLRRVRTEVAVADLTVRIEAARRQKEVAQIQFEHYAARREQQSALLQNGIITDTRLDATAIRAMDAERIYLDKHEALLRLESERRLVQNEAELTEVERVKALRADLRKLATETEAVKNDFYNVLAELNLFNADGTRLAVMIDRPTGADGLRTIAAGPDTLVRPGDLLTVTTGHGENVEETAILRPQETHSLIRVADAK